MLALYVRKHADAGAEAAQIPQALLRGDRRVIADDAPLLVTVGSGAPGSLYRQPPAGFFERAVLAPTLPLRASAWSRSLLGRVNRAVCPGGEISLPIRAGEGMLTLADLTALLGEPVAPPEAAAGGVQYATFRRAELPEAPSLLEWFVDSSAELALDLVGTAALTTAERYSLLRDVGAPYVGTVAAEHEHSYADLPADLEEACYLVRQWAWGLSYKAPLLRLLLRRFFPERDDLRIADLGSGPGWVTAELLVEPESGVRSAVNVDFSPGYAVAARKMYDRYAATLAGRFGFDVVPMDEFVGSELDAVSFLGGTLTYVERARRLAVLEAAWSALSNGGVLVVLENIKAPRFGAVQEQMFEAAELDALLGRFGDVSYFSSQVAAEVPAERVGNKTVFRVVRKLG